MIWVGDCRLLLHLLLGINRVKGSVHGGDRRDGGGGREEKEKGTAVEATRSERDKVYTTGSSGVIGLKVDVLLP
jgi:hypothetical protein